MATLLQGRCVLLWPPTVACCPAAGAVDKSPAELEKERAEARAAVEGTRGCPAQTKVSHKKLAQVKVCVLLCNMVRPLAPIHLCICAAPLSEPGVSHCSAAT